LAAQEQIKLLEDLFKTYQPMLVSFAFRYVKSVEDAKGVVQEVFISVWNNRESLRMDGNLKSYLFTATKNKCLNFLEKKRLKTISLDHAPGDFSPATRIPTPAPDTNEVLAAEELRAVIFDEIQKLPPKCRDIFILSREEQLSYKEIAEKQGVSPKTVENQIGIALRRIRQRVENYQRAEARSGNISPALLAFIIAKVLIELGVGDAASVW